MKKSGLLNKLQVLIVLVLVIQLFGLNLFINLATVVAIENGPIVSITSPATGVYYNQSPITVSGTVENFQADASVILYEGTQQIGTTTEIINGTWSIMVELTEEGSHSLHAEASDSSGNTDTSETISITTDFTSPTITFVKPTSGAYVNTSSIEGTTESRSTVKLCIDCIMGENGQVNGTWVETAADVEGVWTYNADTLANGNHTIFAKAIDRAGNEGSVSEVSYILDKTRPIVLPDVFPKHDMTQVSLDTTIKIKISDATLLDLQAIENSITLSQNGTSIPGVNSFDPITKEVTFTPMEPLTAGKKYNVLVNSAGLVDAAGNMGRPRFWSFITEVSTTVEHENPHEYYNNNVNICGNCHSTHAAANPNLLDSKTIQVGETFSVDNYCMACHDGTVAPKPSNTDKTHKHDAAVSLDGKPNGSSCSSCHNPHLDWSEKNPNFTQDQIVYTHLPSDPVNEDKPVGKISSKEQLCESCHESDSAEKIAHPAVEYRLFEYKKWNSASGILEDFELCLRCHNQNFRQKYASIPVISDFYSNLTEELKKQYEITNGSGSFSNREITVEEKNFSGHIIKAQDGSPLAGHIPCAECHDTHGSSNIMNLKTRIGHENIGADFIAESGEWDASKERSFCTKCHNGSTSLYGITVKQLDVTKSDGHNTTDQRACSTCHGYGENKALSAAHAPRKNPTTQ
ncbi:Ig-like domain-containing protein [Neobacillus sp. LXY-4]|uniref:Ig-like domain-containing protein n=1 Tax=Neobacillus sp. LXY-4 TaxID=3379826 RepID=UPI003EDFD49D